MGPGLADSKPFVCGWGTVSVGVEQLESESDETEFRQTRGCWGGLGIGSVCVSRVKHWLKVWVEVVRRTGRAIGGLGGGGAAGMVAAGRTEVRTNPRAWLRLGVMPGLVRLRGDARGPCGGSVALVLRARDFL